MTEPTTRICRNCGRELPSTAGHFHRQKTGVGGLRSVCKDCLNSLRRTERAAVAHKPAVAPAPPRRKPIPLVPFSPTPPLPGELEAVARWRAKRAAKQKLEFDAALSALVALTDEVPRPAADLSTPRGRAAAIHRQEGRKALMDSLRPHEPNEMWLEFAEAADGDRVEALGKVLAAANIVVVPS